MLKEFGDPDNAVRNARRLMEHFEGRTDYANHNPGTRAFELIEELNNLNKEI